MIYHLNSQPWYFVHEVEAIHACCAGKGIIPYMNRIGIGIALTHLYVANEDNFRFFVAEIAPGASGYGYVGNMTL